MSERKFEGLHEQLLNTPDVVALAYPGGGPNSLDFLPAKITRIVLPDDFSVHSLIQGTEHGNIHLLYLLSRALFGSLRLTGIKPVARFFVNDYSVETIWSEDPSLPFTKKLSYTRTPEDEVRAAFPFVPPTLFNTRGFRQIPSESEEKQQKSKEETVSKS